MMDEPSEEELPSSRSGNELPPSFEKFAGSDETAGTGTFSVNIGRRQSSITIIVP